MEIMTGIGRPKSTKKIFITVSQAQVRNHITTFHCKTKSCSITQFWAYDTSAMSNSLPNSLLDLFN